MKDSHRDTKGLGNATKALRIPSGANFWDFVALAWVAVEGADTLPKYTEYANAGDAVQSRYEITITPPPGGPWPFEVVNVTTGLTTHTGDTSSDIIIKIGRNKLDFNKTTNMMVLYADDDITPLYTFTMVDNATHAIRGRGV